MKRYTSSAKHVGERGLLPFAIQGRGGTFFLEDLPEAKCLIISSRHDRLAVGTHG